MGINDIILYIMLFFMVLGALDKILGNKYHLGDKFDEGFHAMGPLSIAMLGIVAIAPVMADVLGNIIVPVYTFLGADPSMFATTLLANDMGGYPLAMAMAQTREAGLFAGLILGSMMGPTIVFTIPVALGIIEKKDQHYFVLGIMLGMITIPLGCLAGGITAGFTLSMILANLVPVTLFSLLIATGLYFQPDMMIRIFSGFGKLLMIFITVCTVISVTETLTGWVILSGMTPIWDGIKIVGSIAIVLIGAFPMVTLITRLLKKPLMKAGKSLGINHTAAAGMIATLANCIPMLHIMKDMDARGKVLNTAFAVSASFVLGDHLGFTAGVAREMIFPVIMGKIVGGITALLLGIMVVNRLIKNIPNESS